MPYSCQEIPYSISIGIDISKNEIKDNELDFPIDIIKSNEFSNYDYLITPISIFIIQKMKFLVKASIFYLFYLKMINKVLFCKHILLYDL